MTQPPAYTPVTNFITFEAQQAWFPGQELDVEFNDIETTTAAIRANLALIQKDDGTLVNGIVDFNNLTAAFRAQLIAQGFVPPVSPVVPSNGIFNVTDYGALGNGVHDDGPAFRAAIAAAITANFGQVYVPLATSSYLINSLDPSGLGALVIGDGSRENSCSIVGQAVNTHGDFQGGVNIKLGNGLNRPLLFIRKQVASPVLSNIRLEGNSAGQTGYGGGPTGLLFTIVIEDFPGSTLEGSIQMFNSWVFGGYNGNLYVGSGRGGTVCYNTWFFDSGTVATRATDVNVYMNGTDANFDYCVFAGDNNTGIGGYGLLLNEGSQYLLSNCVFFDNYIGELVNSACGYCVHNNCNYQFQRRYGVETIGSGAGLGQAHIWTGCTFDGNSQEATNTYADCYVHGDLYAAFVGCGWVGNSNGSPPLASYNILADGTSAVKVSAPVYKSGSSAGTAFLNDPSKFILAQPGFVNIGNAAVVSATYLTLNVNTQNHGFILSNGTNVVAALIGKDAGNDGGVFRLLSGGVTKIELNAQSFSYFNGTSGVAIGSAVDPGAGTLAVSTQANFGPATVVSNNIVTINSATTGKGLFLENGANVVAGLFGASGSNDNGVLQLNTGGAVGAKIQAAAFSVLLGGGLNVGTNADPGSGTINASTALKVAATQVVGARVTGWGAGSNGSRTAFNGSGATLAQTSAAVAQLIIDLTTHGLIGA